ncbi:hypothetical protein OS189_04960 [Sulfitobacter sp. F26169L]|uniref:hypothetical protein n=1 Tax=Sulfitobacter sp. F26169L TaxID=2996015 RepID=UPI002260AC77|nr:hypothetical protein [Sulfitobacter sp. F26169L]MCX7565686.1 hypothetical protein [Sulfitobacter sp. F26169L]
METLILLKPYAYGVAFICLSVSVVAGWWRDWLGDGIRVGNKAPRNAPVTSLQRVLHAISQISMVIFWLCLVLVFGLTLTTA